MQSTATLLMGTFAGRTPSATGPTYKINVPAGKVTADLTNFPLMIDLSHLPSSFWEQVRADGGNIRAYTQQGITLLPLDVTYINKSRRIGRMFVRRTLLAAQDNTVIIRLLSRTTTKAADSGLFGRNAVWSEYEVVWVFPETVNRTGKTYTQVSSSLLAHSEYVRTGYRVLTGSPHNGICTDGTHFISTDDIVLRRMNMSYVVQQTVTNINTALSAMTGLSNFDHMGDPVCVGLSTFFTVTTSDATYRRFLVEYRTSDLTLLNAWEMTGAQRIFGAGVAYDGTHLVIISYEDDTKFIKYTTTGSYVGQVVLTNRPAGMIDFQGITVMPSGNIFISGDPLTIYEVTPYGNVLGAVYKDPHAGIMEGLENRGGTLWLLKGNGALIDLRNDVVTDFRKLYGGDTMHAVFPTSTTWSAGTTAYWTTFNFQQNFLEIADNDNVVSSRSTGLLFDDGPDQVGIWNSTDRWLYVSPTLNPAAYDNMRLSMAHQGTTQRKVRARKGTTNYTNVDNTVGARPLGTNTRFQINSTGGAESYYQYTWYRYGYVTDAWLQADADNVYDPATFYTVTTISTGRREPFYGNVISAYNNFGNYTVRSVFGRGTLPGSAKKLRVTLTAPTGTALTYSKTYVGRSTLGVFATAPTQLFFAGSASVTIPAGTTVTSDEIDFSYDGIGEICVSMYVPGQATPHLATLVGGGRDIMHSLNAGDFANSMGTNWSISNAAYNVARLEMFIGDTWECVFQPGGGAITNGWNNYTLRSRIEPGVIALSKASFRIGMQSQIAEMFVGNAVDTAGSFDFASTPTRVTFGGANGITGLVPGQTYISDTLSTSILDLTKPILFSQYQNGNYTASIFGQGLDGRYTGGNVVSNLGAFSGAPYGTTFFGPVLIDQM